ncbi:Glycerol kinase [compost metagenome]
MINSLHRLAAHKLRIDADDVAQMPCRMRLKAIVHSDLDQIAGLWQRQQRFDPRMSAEHRSKLYHGWLDAVQRVRSEG